MRKTFRLKLITLLIPFLCSFLYILKAYIVRITLNFPICPFYQVFHLYCPACGNTRSVLALLKGDILTSLRYNIVPILLLFLCLCAYIELATYSFGKYLQVLPRKPGFYICLIFLILLYFVIRNFFPFLTP